MCLITVTYSLVCCQQLFSYRLIEKSNAIALSYVCIVKNVLKDTKIMKQVIEIESLLCLHLMGLGETSISVIKIKSYKS